MPPRTTQKSHRPRVSDRTMVGNCHPLLASAKEAAGKTRKNMTPRTSHKGEKQNHALEKCIAAANRGWMSEKFLPPADQGKCFYLTSPFIEPVRLSPICRAVTKGGVIDSKLLSCTNIPRCEKIIFLVADNIGLLAFKRLIYIPTYCQVVETLRASVFMITKSLFTIS